MEAAAPAVVALLKVAPLVVVVPVVLALAKYRGQQLVLQAKAMPVEMVHGPRRFSLLVMSEEEEAALVPLVEMDRVFIILLLEAAMADRVLFLRHLNIHMVILEAEVAARMEAPPLIWPAVARAQPPPAAALAAREVVRMPEIQAL